MSKKTAKESEEKREEKSLSASEISAIVEERIARRIQGMEERFATSMERLSAMLDNNRVSATATKEREEVAEDVHILLDEEVKNRRSANELAVLQRLLALTIGDPEVDLKKRMSDLASIIRARMFLLELSEKVGWGVALAYIELFPGDFSLIPKNLHQAMEYNETLMRIREKRPKKKTGSSGLIGKAITKGGTPIYGACFACGAPDHWAKDCPIRKAKTG